MKPFFNGKKVIAVFVASVMGLSISIGAVAAPLLTFTGDKAGDFSKVGAKIDPAALKTKYADLISTYEAAYPKPSDLEKAFRSGVLDTLEVKYENARNELNALKKPAKGKGKGKWDESKAPVAKWGKNKVPVVTLSPEDTAKIDALNTQIEAIRTEMREMGVVLTIMIDANLRTFYAPLISTYIATYSTSAELKKGFEINVIKPLYSKMVQSCKKYYVTCKPCDKSKIGQPNLEYDALKADLQDMQALLRIIVDTFIETKYADLISTYKAAYPTYKELNKAFKTDIFVPLEQKLAALHAEKKALGKAGDPTKIAELKAKIEAVLYEKKGMQEVLTFISKLLSKKN